MLPTAEVVNSVMFEGDTAEGFLEGAVWAQMGTIGVTATTQAASRLAARRPDVLYVDAPVSGSKGAAQTHQLLVLASGPHAARSIVSRAFSALGRKTVWLGEAGQGSRMKLAVNAYMAILIEGVAEARALAGRLGIDDHKLAEAIEGGPLDAPIAEAKSHKMEEGDFAPEFPLEWALKDVDLAIGESAAPLRRSWVRSPGYGTGPSTRASAGRTSAPRTATPPRRPGGSRRRRAASSSGRRTPPCGRGTRAPLRTSRCSRTRRRAGPASSRSFHSRRAPAGR